MRTRVLTSAVALPILFLVLFMGEKYILFATMLTSLVALYEFYSAFEYSQFKPVKVFGYICTLVLYVIYYLKLAPVFYGACISILLYGLLIYMVISAKSRVIDIAITILGFLYISCSFIYIAVIVREDNNFFIWYVFLLAWITDTFAYFAGRFFGKRKLIERVSPKKTVEGAIGGVVGSVMVVAIFAWIFKREFVFFSIILGLLGSVISQFGDLIASKIKRYCGIKDFGKIFPGHGGILDRFDSIILTAPFVYYFMKIYEWVVCHV